MSLTQVEDVNELVEHDLTNEAVQGVIDRQEAWLASRVGDLEQYDPGVVVDAVIELVYVAITLRGAVTSERAGTHAVQTFQNPEAAAVLRKLAVRRVKALAPGTIRILGPVSEDDAS